VKIRLTLPSHTWASNFQSARGMLRSVTNSPGIHSKGHEATHSRHQITTDEQMEWTTLCIVSSATLEFQESPVKTKLTTCNSTGFTVCRESGIFRPKWESAYVDRKNNYREMV
jgi:hypothetical protein